MAIALKNIGHEVTGSDDEIFEPSKSRLASHGLLPNKMGWNEDNITKDLDLIILGMHALKNNPELLKAREMKIPVNSYPEFLYKQSVNKKRIVIAGSHGKTSTTSMVLHVLKDLNLEFDFMVGAQIKGFDTMVKLSDAPIIILEGDEYFSSPIDMKAKFLWYKPHVAVITGIAWDHINVYPTKEKYNKAFIDFIRSVEDDGCYYYFGGDETLNEIVNASRSEVLREAYIDFNHKVENGVTVAVIKGKEYSLRVFGDHNIQNMQAARLISHSIGINDEKFFTSISSFDGASNRLELIAEQKGKRVFKDFAHSPSKLKATVNACKQQYPDSKLLAVMELHTFSSLNKEFLSEYAHSLDEADQAIVYFSPEVIEHKKLKNFSIQDVKDAFQNENLLVVTRTEDLKHQVKELSKDHQTILLMSSGNFGGIDVDKFVKQVLVGSR